MLIKKKELKIPFLERSHPSLNERRSIENGCHELPCQHYKGFDRLRKVTSYLKV